MNTLPADTQSAVLRALVEGNSIRATCRMTGVAKGTVLRLLAIVGAHCKNHHDRFVRNVASKRVQCDEIWSFVGMKEKRVPDERKGRGLGDIWTWTALDADSKLLLGYRVGDRDLANARAFMQDTADRLSTRVQLTTDGLRWYLTAVEAAFGWNGCDFAQLIKVYGHEQEGTVRYSPPEVIGTDKRWVMGEPAEAHVSTSYVERSNLTMRMQMRRFTRLTNAFSKKKENHLYAVALHATFYNYCRPHMTLTKERGGIKTTPAMAAGLTDRVWGLEDILNLLHGD